MVARRFARLFHRSLVLPALAAALAAPASAAAANGRIAFTSDRDGDSEIYSVRLDGGGAVNLTNHWSTDQSPAWSPGGERIAFGSFRDGRQAIFIMRADGTEQTRVSPEAPYADDADPAWSPDGRRIAFSSSRPWGDGWAVWTMNADGTDLTRVSPGFGSDPAWSPDGTRIAYVGLDPTVDGGSAVFVMDADGGNARRLTTATLAEDQPAWSPDGSEVVFARFRADWRESNAHELWVAAADGSSERRLTDGGFYDGNPSWSPDGTAIVFQRHQGFGEPQLYVVGARGGEPAWVDAGAGRNFAPAWGASDAEPVPTEPAPDTTRPTVWIGVPGYDDSYVVGADVRAEFWCRDDRDGPDAVRCEATVRDESGERPLFPGEPLPTATVGNKVVTVIAEDRAGNRTGETRGYRVVYPFDGFHVPLEPFPAAAVFKAGHGVPVRFSLGGYRGMDVFSFAPLSVELPCDAMPAVGFGVETTGRLSYNASVDRYTYLWATESAWAGTCRQLVVVLADGTYHHANVRFAK